MHGGEAAEVGGNPDRNQLTLYLPCGLIEAADPLSVPIGRIVQDARVYMKGECSTALA